LPLRSCPLKPIIARTSIVGDPRRSREPKFTEPERRLVGRGERERESVEDNVDENEPKSNPRCEPPGRRSCRAHFLRNGVHRYLLTSERVTDKNVRITRRPGRRKAAARAPVSPRAFLPARLQALLSSQPNHKPALGPAGERWAVCCTTKSCAVRPRSSRVWPNDILGMWALVCKSSTGTHPSDKVPLRNGSIEA
jgi:hypothetical protein